MGQIVRMNQKLILPGVGFVIQSGEPPVDLVRGTGALVGPANWGPLNTVQTLGAPGVADRLFGKRGVSGATLGADITEAFKGAATLVKAVRVGQNGTGTKASKTVADTGTPTNILRIDAKWVGTEGNQLDVALRDNPDTVRRDLLVYYRDGLVETFSYNPGADEAAAVVAAVAAQGSDWITPVKLAAGNGTAIDLAQTALTGGANPTITNADYTTAMNALEQEAWYALGVGSDDDAVHALVKAYIDRIIMAGHRRIGIVGEPHSVAFSTRQAHAMAFNDPAIVFVANGFAYTGADGVTDVVCEGHLAAAREVGRWSSLTYGRQLTQAKLTDANRVVGALDTDLGEPETAALSGMYFYDTNARGRVRSRVGINTFWNPDQPPTWAEDADAGWGKGRVIQTRFGILDDVDADWDDQIETTSNTPQALDLLAKRAERLIRDKYAPVGAVSETLADGTPAPIKVSVVEAGPDGATYEMFCVTADGAEKLKVVTKFRR